MCVARVRLKPRITLYASSRVRIRAILAPGAGAMRWPARFAWGILVQATVRYMVATSITVSARSRHPHTHTGTAQRVA